MRRKSFFLLSLLILIALLPAACGKFATLTLEPIQTPTPASKNLPMPAVVPAKEGILVIPALRTDRWVRDFNPFGQEDTALLSRGLIYESLMLYHPAKAEFIPRLATGYAWSDSGRTLTFEIRKGVKWSDGAPFTAQDVAFTFRLIDEHPDIWGLLDYPHPHPTGWPFSLLKPVAEVFAPDDFTVIFRFEDVNVLLLHRIAAVPVVPKHIWQNVSNPAAFANENPVGTGPFTQVTVFESRSLEYEDVLQLERNPFYWQAGKPFIQGVRYSFRPQEEILKDLRKGKLDWSAEQEPEFEKSFANEDPQNFHTGFTDDAMILLSLNTAKPPLNNPDVRKAISLAINRERIVETVFHGNTAPANATGLGGRYRAWWNEEAIRAGNWTAYDPEQASGILKHLGQGPGGRPMSFTLAVETTYTDDREAIARMISENLKDIGIQATIVVKPYGTMGEMAGSETYDLAIFYDDPGLTPDEFYHNQMSASGWAKFDWKTNAEAGRYTNAKANILLEDFTHESDPVCQRAIIDRLQVLFVEDAPAIPLSQSFTTYQYSTRRFTDFPEEDPYVLGNPYLPLNVLVLLNVRPK